MCASEWFSVELHAVGLHVRCPSNGAFFWIHEQAYSNTGTAQRPNDGRYLFSGRSRRPSSLTCDFTRADGNQCALGWLDLMHQREQVPTGITLDVELDRTAGRAQQVRDLSYISRRDVTSVSSWVHGDARHSGIDTHAHRIKDGRDGASSRIAKRRNLIDVD
jgi:hypothetical protein